MAGAEHQPRLFADSLDRDGTVVINDRCVLRTADGVRVVIVLDVVVAHYVVADRMAETYAMVNLVEHGWAGRAAIRPGASDWPLAASRSCAASKRRACRIGRSRDGSASRRRRCASS